MKKFIKILLLVLASAFLFSIAWGEEKKADKPVDLFKAVIDSDGIQRVEVVGGGYFFKPNYIVVKANVPVELTIKKEPGYAPHDIVINAPEAGIDFKESLDEKPRIIKFTPTKVGKYPLYCSKKLLFFKSHRDKGMEGTLEVVE